jgi:GNAT superfamily N-acetyltransferase
MPASNAAYVALAESDPAWLAVGDDGPIGLMILKSHPEAVENWLLAVRRAHHNSGAGPALIAKADEAARLAQARYLTVKTLGPSMDYEPYARTRGFYRAVGFTPLEEFTEIWGPENPCLFMVRPVSG